MKKGFTLIELIVVVAVVGVLAVGLMMAINPIEQINKAKDTKKVNQAKEIIDAAERYKQIIGTGPASCAVLTAAGELDSCGTGLTEDGWPGSLKIKFTPASKAYEDACGNPCIVPDGIGGIGG